MALTRGVDEVLAAVRARAQARDVALATLLPEQPVVLWADRYLLHSMLLNLVDNAVKFSPAGGRVRIEVEAGAGGVRMAIHDEGPGIPPEQTRRIFEKFYCANSDTEGSGLGLVIARQAARVHGGDITVTSMPGAGSTFSVQLPPSCLAGTTAAAADAR